MFQINRQVVKAKSERWVSDALHNAVKVIFSSRLNYDDFPYLVVFVNFYNPDSVLIVWLT